MEMLVSFSIPGCYSVLLCPVIKLYIKAYSSIQRRALRVVSKMQAVPQDNVQTSGGVRHKTIIYTAVNIYWIIVISSTKNILLNISTTMSSLEHCTKMSFPSLLVPTTKTWKSKISYL